jgi:hypothetical protein
MTKLIGDKPPTQGVRAQAQVRSQLIDRGAKAGQSRRIRYSSSRAGCSEATRFR